MHVQPSALRNCRWTLQSKSKVCSRLTGECTGLVDRAPDRSSWPACARERHCREHAFCGEWQSRPQALRENLAAFLHYTQTRPDFLSWRVDDLPHAIPFLLRTQLETPVITWTVRREEQRARAAQWADQIVFEGFLP